MSVYTGVDGAMYDSVEIALREGGRKVQQVFDLVKENEAIVAGSNTCEVFIGVQKPY